MRESEIADNRWGEKKSLNTAWLNFHFSLFHFLKLIYTWVIECSMREWVNELWEWILFMSCTNVEKPGTIILMRIAAECVSRPVRKAVIPVAWLRARDENDWKWWCTNFMQIIARAIIATIEKSQWVNLSALFHEKIIFNEWYELNEKARWERDVARGKSTEQRWQSSGHTQHEALRRSRESVPRRVPGGAALAVSRARNRVVGIAVIDISIILEHSPAISENLLM